MKYAKKKNIVGIGVKAFIDQDIYRIVSLEHAFKHHEATMQNSLQNE